MKNATNTYGYYLTEDSETIEFRGNFESNKLFLKTKNPFEQLNYKVFVSPKKTINFAIQIVGGSNPQTIYIPQHIYKELQTAYDVNNPYYTIKDITTIKLDFSSSGNSLITYLKTKFEKGENGSLSKIENAGATGISTYAGFDEGGNPIDEDILKQILYLYEEQNEVIFVEKDDELVTENIVKNREYTSNRIKGNFTYTSNYFDDSGKFNSGLLNSQTNIKIESTTTNSILQLNDFVKDFAGKSLTDLNSIYKGNISTEQIVTNAPKVLGLAMEGLSKVAPLFTGVKDKLVQLKTQKAQKKLEEAKALGGSLSGQLDTTIGGMQDKLQSGIDNATGQATEAIDSVKGLFSTSKDLVSQYKTSVSLKAEGGVSNKFTIPSMDAESNQFSIPSSDSVSNKFSVPSASGLSNKFSVPSTNAISNKFNIPITGVSNPFTIGGGSGTSNPFTIGGGVSNSFTISNVGNVLPITNSIKTISTIGNVSVSEGLNMIKNASGQTTETLKAANADFLKGN